MIIYRKVSPKRYTFLFFIISIIPYGLWSLRNFFILGVSTGRRVSFYPPSAGDIYDTLAVFCNIAIPSIGLNVGLLGKKIIIIVYTSIIAMVFIVNMTNKVFSSRINRLVNALYANPYNLILLVYSVSYLTFSYIWKYVVENNTLTTRLFIPLIVVLFVATPHAVRKTISTATKGKFVEVMIIVVALLFTALSFGYTYDRYVYRTDWSMWRSFEGIHPESDLVSKIKEIPRAHVIYSNFAVLLSYETKRKIYQLPEIPIINHLNIPRIEKNYEALVLNDSERRRMSIAWYSWKWGGRIAPDSILTRYRLSPRIVADDGVIYYPVDEDDDTVSVMDRTFPRKETTR